jgi:hypothetical protein
MGPALNPKYAARMPTKGLFPQAPRKSEPSGAEARPVAPLSIEELEFGLLSLDRHDVDLKTFWDKNIVGFRRTVLFAIRETSEALLSPTITLRWRIELQSQLEDLVRYIRLADRYVARRTSNSESFVDDSAAKLTTH